MNGLSIILTFLGAFIALFTMQACEEKNSDPVDFNAQKSSVEDLAGMINSAGTLHNEFLAACYEEFEQGSIEPDADPTILVAFAQGFFEENLPEYDIDPFIPIIEEPFIVQDSAHVTVGDLYDLINTSTDIPSSAQAILISTVNSMEDYMDETITLTEYIDICDAKIADALLLGTDEEVLSCGVPISIMKHSAEYWNTHSASWEAIENGNTLKFNDRMGKINGRQEQLGVLAADAYGALYGVISGAASGSIAPGFGTGVGMFLGGLLGGGMASLQSGLFTLVIGIFF